jgi:hypothetical protein
LDSGQGRDRVASCRSDGGRRIWRLKVKPAVWPGAVVVAHVDAEDVLEVTATGDEQPVKALATHSANPALYMRVRIRRPDWRTDDPDTYAVKERIERLGELAVSVVK